MRTDSGTTGPGGTTQCFSDAKGHKLNYAPEVTATLGANYKLPTQIGTFTIDGLLSYVDTQHAGPDNLYAIPKNTLVNAALTWTSRDSHYSVQLWSKNMFDQRYLNDVLEETGGVLQAPGDPRTFGVTASAKF